MRQVGCVLLPVVPIKRQDSQRLGCSVETADIDVDATRIGAGNIERFDTAHLAKQMLGNSGIECVSGEVIAAFEQTEFRFGHNQM